ncbi:MAG: FIST C-terminal domain-containing protein, partial [Pseudomonadota bacterium]
KGNVLSSLNYASAYSFYQKQVEANTANTHDNFASMARNYPLGIENLDGEILVREPIHLKDEQLVCIGEIHENSVVYLLKGKPENLVEAAGQTARSLGVMEKPRKRDSVLLFDCLSRAQFLGDEFYKELDNISNNLSSKDALFGALTIGEICSNSNGQVRLLNKSTVLAAF